MARNSSGGGARGPRKGQGTPVEDAEIVAGPKAEPGSGAPGGTDTSAGTADETPTGTASVEATPDAAPEGVADAAPRSGEPVPSDDASGPAGGTDASIAADPWEAVPGALTPPEAGHPEAVADAGGMGGGALVRRGASDLVAPESLTPAPPAPPEPTAADTPEVVITPAPHDMPSDPPEDRAATVGTATGAGAGAAVGAGALGTAAAAGGRGTPPDLDPPHAAPSPVATPPAPARSGGALWPLVLGGVIAGLIGLGAGWLLSGRGPAPAAIEARVDALESEVAALTGGTDLAPVNARLDEMAAGIPTLTEVEDRLGAIETALAVPAEDPLSGRLDEVEGRFIEVESLAEAVGELRGQVANLATGLADAGEGAAQGAAAVASTEGLGTEITAAARRLDELSAQVEELRAGLAALEDVPGRLDTVAERANATRADLNALSAERDRLTAAAEAEASSARAEAAMAQLRAAVDTGAPFAAPLAAFEEASGRTAADPLPNLADEGVPSLAQLQADWPEAARAALAEAPAEPGPGGFLRAQFGIRSLGVRDGDSADAVLSRAEAALRQGDVEGTLAALDGLSESPRAALRPWTDRAEERLAATRALDDLAPSAAAPAAPDADAPDTEAQAADAPADGEASADQPSGAGEDAPAAPASE